MRDFEIQGTSPSRDEILRLIWQTVPPGSPEPQDPATLEKLIGLTEALIQVSGQKRLQTDPFSDVNDRSIRLHEPELAVALANKVILVTGGQGFIGKMLIEKINRSFDVQRVVSVDSLVSDLPKFEPKPTTRTSNHAYTVDVRDYDALEAIFELEKPDIVFHLAAQRLPGLAERQVYQTTTTNILGSDHLIRLCEQKGVEACIFASTGKASRYFTPDIYAGSKKIAEWIFADQAQSKKTRYGIVRFTHVVENSPISLEIDQKIERGIVALHAPDRYTYAQNVTESIYLLLNALTVLEPGRVKLLAVRDLGWCINTLDIALHKIIMADRRIPIYFQGLPLGYEKGIFMGQLDLSGTEELLPMFNILELDGRKLSTHQDIVISEIHPFSSSIFQQQLAEIKQQISLESDILTRTVLHRAIENILFSSFLQADLLKLINILKWGFDLKKIEDGGMNRDCLKIIELLIKSIYKRLLSCQISCQTSGFPRLSSRMIKELKKNLPSFSEEISYLEEKLSH
jgi:NADP-dependent 3-hydroxy acid dehydrogenase YdfG